MITHARARLPSLMREPACFLLNKRARYNALVTCVPCPMSPADLADIVEECANQLDTELTR